MVDIKVYVNEERKFEFLTGDKEKFYGFLEINKTKWINLRLMANSEKRTYAMNKRYRALLQAFVPDHFDSGDEAHEYFTDRYLSKNDIFDQNEDSLNDILDNIKKYARKIKSIKTYDHKVQIVWVRSTASLTKDEFSDLMLKVELEGSHWGIQFNE